MKKIYICLIIFTVILFIFLIVFIPLYFIKIKKFEDGVRCTGTECDRCDYISSTWFDENELQYTACGIQNLFLKKGSACEGTECDKCLSPATTWIDDGIRQPYNACGTQASFMTDGQRCEGIICEKCISTETTWIDNNGSQYTACGKQHELLRDGDQCNGEGCKRCLSGISTPYYSLDGSEISASLCGSKSLKDIRDGIICTGHGCSRCINPGTMWYNENGSERGHYCGQQQKILNDGVVCTTNCDKCANKSTIWPPYGVKCHNAREVQISGMYYQERETCGIYVPNLNNSYITC